MAQQSPIGGQPIGGITGDSVVDEFEVLDIALDGIFEVSHWTMAHLQLPSQGSLSARLDVTLPKNAMVDVFEIKVTARRADEALAGAVTELRGEQGAEDDAHVIVVDFGTVRTVSAVRFTVASHVRQVEAWTGTEFPRSTTNAPFRDTTELPAGGPYNLRFARFRSDVRTERLRVTVLSTEPIDTLLSDMLLILPDTPKDLSVTVDGGTPVWSLPGPAAMGTDAALSTDAWNDNNERLVDLADTFRGLTGDPLNSTDQTFELTLASREAGVLQIDLHRAEYRRIRRATFGGASRTALRMDAEGVTDVVLNTPDAPAGAIAEELTLTASGEFKLERRIPAVGPEPRLTGNGADPSAPLIEVEMTSERAMILQLSAVAGLAALSGLRLPFRAGADGAEVRIEPWSNVGPGRAQPHEALGELIGEPVTLFRADGADPAWRSFRLPAPLQIAPDNPPWIAVLVTRGSVTVGLSEETGAPMRIGPPSGPWRQLPALFGTGVFRSLRCPYRVIGDAAEATDPAPLQVSIVGAAGAPVTLDPIAAGTSLRLSGIDVAAPVLRITHFAPGKLDLDGVDIVFDV